jgi:ATP-binding cassette subfamily B protein
MGVMAQLRNQVRLVGALVASERWRYACALVALLVGTLLIYLIPLVPTAVLDVVFGNNPEKAAGLSTTLIDWIGGAGTVRDALWRPAILIGVFAICAGGFVHLRQRFAANAAQNISRRLRRRIYDHVQRLPCRTHEKLESGDLLQRCSSDVDTVTLFLGEQIVMIGRAFAMLLVPLPLMFAIDWRMSVVSLLLVVPISIFSYLFFNRMRSRFLDKEKAEARLTATVNENLNGIRVVRSFARQDFENERFEVHNRLHRDRDNLLYRLMARFWSLSDALCFTQQGLVLGFGLWWMIQGSIEIGTLYFFISVVSMFLWPVRMLGRILAEFGKALVAIGRIEEILERPIESQPEKPATPEQLSGGFRFEDVSLRHGDLPVLDGISFEVSAGETLALVGAAGSGKTTIVDLLLRLHDPDEGAISFDDVPINQLDRGFVRSRIAAVMQQPFLYSKSIRENIAITCPELGSDPVEAAAMDACIHDSIHAFDQGYETRVGERGLTLSGGQRQRVAIARALVQRPDILILDDALSAVDTRTERQILTAINRRHGSQTTLIIAHRLSTIEQADRILVLESGRVAQQGTHQELISQPGMYRRIWELQSSSPGTLPPQRGGAA